MLMISFPCMKMAIIASYMYEKIDMMRDKKL